MDKLIIKGPRQRRVIVALLEGPVSVKDLGPKIGALNPRQIVHELRLQGFNGIIHTRRYTIIDQDGKRCRPGEYYINNDDRLSVMEALMQHDTKKQDVSAIDINKRNNTTNEGV